MATNQLKSSVSIVLDVVNVARRQEIELMEAELEALDRAPPPEVSPSYASKMEEAIKESYGMAMSQIDGLALPFTPQTKGPDEQSRSFGECVVTSPDIHIFSDDDIGTESEEEQVRSCESLLLT